MLQEALHWLLVYQKFGWNGNKTCRKILYEQLHLFTLMKRRRGVKQGLRKCWFHLQNEIKTRWGDSKNEIGFDVHHIYEHIDVKDWKTRPIMVEKCQNLRNEIKTR